MTYDSAARVKKRRLNQSTCTNSDIPLWLNTRKPPARKDGPQHHPTKDKTNRILYIMCGVLAIMLVGIFTKLGLEKAHRRQRKPSPDDPLGSLENRTGLEDHVLLEPGLGYSVEAGPPGQGDLLSSMLPSSSVPELMTTSKLLSLLRQCRVSLGPAHQWGTVVLAPV